MPVRIEPLSGGTGGGGGTGNLAAVSIPGGNTSGVLTVISSGTVYLAGGNNITLSQNGQSITISGGASGGSGFDLSLGGNTAGTLTLISSGTAYLAGGNNITLSQNGQSITISAANQSNQTVGLYASSNTYLTSSGTVDARSLTFRGDKSITVGISAGEVVFSVGAYLTTAMASNRGSDFVAATAAFNGTNASGTIASNAISVSVAAQSVQSAIKAFGASNTGNTAGNTGVSTGIDWVIAGSNNVTISESTAAGGPNTLWVSGPTAGAAQTGISGVVVSDTTYTSGTISFSNAGNITISSSVNGATQYVRLSVAAQSNQSAIKAFGVSNTGNTAGNTGVSTGIDWVLAASNSLTLSQSTAAGGPDTVWVQVGAYITTADLSQNSSKYVQNWKLTGNTAGTTSSAQGTDLWFSGGNSITVSGNSNTIVFSVGAYLTTAALSGDTSKYIQAWELTGNTAGTTSSLQGTKIYFSGGNSITVSGNSNTIVLSVGNYLTTAMASGDSTKFVQANATFNGTNASGTIASNAISVSVAAPIPIATAVKAVASVGSTGTITRYAPEDHQHAGVAAFAVTNTGNTAGNTRSQVGTLFLAGTGGITASQSTGAAGNDTIWFSVATASNSPVNFSAGTTSNNLATVVFSDSNGVSWGLSGSTITATVSTYSTVGTATTVTPVASANSVGTVTRWAAEDHRHAGVGGIGISTAGNTTGTTGSEVGTYWFQGSNGITLSQITSNNGSHTLVISGNNTTYSNFFEPFYMLDGVATSTGSLSQLGVQPFTLPVPLSFGGAQMVGQATVVPTSGSHNWSIRLTNSTQAFLFSAQYSISNWNLVDFFLFSRGTGVYSSELQTFASTRNSFLTVYQVTQSHSATLTNTAGGSIKVSQSFSMSISYPFMTSSTATSINAASSYTAWGTGYTTWTSTASNSTSDTYSTSAARAIAVGSTYPATVGWSGTKLIYFNFASSLTPGEYWLGVIRFSSQSSSSLTGSTITGAAGTGASYSYTYNATDLNQTAMLTYQGKTNTSIQLGSLGFVTTNNMAPEFALGTFSGTWASSATFLNGLGNPNGAIAPSQLRTGASYFQSWFQLNSNRGGC